MSLLTAPLRRCVYILWSAFHRGSPVSNDPPFNDCVILDQDALDPDAVFLDDIVDDDVLPRLSLAVDGLSNVAERASGRMVVQPEDAVPEPSTPDTTMPVAELSSEVLEVYGWETSLWKKIKGYLGF